MHKLIFLYNIQNTNKIKFLLLDVFKIFIFHEIRLVFLINVKKEYTF